MVCLRLLRGTSVAEPGTIDPQPVERVEVHWNYVYDPARAAALADLLFSAHDDDARKRQAS